MPLRKLFLLDSLGALLSAILLGVVLTQLEPLFGMPSRILYMLSGIAVLLCIYSFLGFLGRTGNAIRSIQTIAIANGLYCALTAGLVIYTYSQLTFLGVLYFVLEMLVVVWLARFEWKTARKNALSTP